VDARRQGAARRDGGPCRIVRDAIVLGGLSSTGSDILSVFEL
jgi:hypothetical protein